jgi:hypothetical protein
MRSTAQSLVNTTPASLVGEDAGMGYEREVYRNRANKNRHQNFLPLGRPRFSIFSRLKTVRFLPVSIVVSSLKPQRVHAPNLTERNDA